MTRRAGHRSRIARRLPSLSCWASVTLDVAAPGGCAFAEAADCPAAQARLLWAASHDVSVLDVEAVPALVGDPNRFDLPRFGGLATVVVSPGGPEHIALSDGYRRIRIDVVSGTVRQGPVRLRYRLDGFHGIDARILTLRRLVSLTRLGRFVRHLHPPERQAPRWVAALRAHDAMLDGASQRSIAIALYGPTMTIANWGQGSDVLRLRVQRLLRVGRHMVQGGYRALLR